MEELLKQIRLKFYELGENQADEYNTEGRLSPQKSVFFKGEKKKVKSWFQSRFTGPRGEKEDNIGPELGAAIAAAAYAIMLAEEEQRGNHKKPADVLKRSPTAAKARRDDGMDQSIDRSKSFRWFAGHEEDRREQGDIFRRKLQTLDERKREEQTLNPIPSIKKAPTSSDTYLNDTVGKTTAERTPSKVKPPPSYFTSGFQNGERFSSGKVLKKADKWEQARMEKIKKRYEKMRNSILQWESEKKVKAKRRMERKERELEMRRARILQEFRNELQRIDMIASGAKAVADDTRRSDELRAKEKAKRSRSMGKDNYKFFCF
ncbi:hypothetical protein HPP92_012974 [Vanilla planifolia]|uniref:Remorin C-terminal domain-containing protein n=1 Tax=Vanilla planifolia TaxID=51239 RepID=A0A835UZK2_VANPL|nr:hypothetical protein HPP92_013438 [Vanilla planifolia]KAG0478255.1 hypothetical protein HPP92_012974 [Vanilla planifolia]